MNTQEVSREEQYRLEIVVHMMEQMNVIDCNSDDRIRYIWALKLIEEDVAKLDQLDRQQGNLPLPLRPSLVLRPQDANLVLRTLNEFVNDESNETNVVYLSLIEKITCYLQAGAYE